MIPLFFTLNSGSGHPIRIHLLSESNYGLCTVSLDAKRRRSRICYQISQESKTRRSGDLWGQKMSPLLLMTRQGKQARRYLMLNLIPRDVMTNSFPGIIRRCQMRVDAQENTITDECNGMCKIMVK